MAFAAIAALSMSSCSQEEELFVKGGDGQAADENAVMFGTYLGKAPESRATAGMDLTGLQTSGFGVFAYYTGENSYLNEEKVPGDFTPNFMYNQELTWSLSNNRWEYSPLKYWPSKMTEKVSFMAYAPYTATFGSEGITALSANDAEGDPKLSFTTPKSVKDQFDLVYSGDLLDLSKHDIDDKVTFTFQHALSRIGFKRVVVVDQMSMDEDGTAGDNDYGQKTDKLDENTTVVINSVKLTGTFATKGKLNLRTGEWKETDLATRTYELTKAGGDFTADGANMTSANADDITRLNADDRYFMIIPNSTDNTLEKTPLTITVNFDVVTKDTSVAGGETRITSEVSNTFNWGFVAGRATDFVLHVALTSVKIDATISDWEGAFSQDPELGSDVNVNITTNNSVSLIYDANKCIFTNNRSRYYIETKAYEEDHKGGYEFLIPDFTLRLPYENIPDGQFVLERAPEQISHIFTKYHGWWPDTTNKDYLGAPDGKPYYKSGEFIKIPEGQRSMTIYCYAEEYEDDL